MKSEKILKGMHIIAWIVFVGLLIKSGSILVSYLVSIKNPEAAKNLFGGLNLFEYRNFDFIQYTFITMYKVGLFLIEAYIAFLVTKLLASLNLKKPFNSNVYFLMKKISYAILYLWGVAIIHNAHVRFIGRRYNFSMDLFSSDFIFLAGVILIFSQIVKKGIELQSENDLTI